MDVNISNKSNWEKVVEVTMPTEELASDFERAFKDYKKRIRLEGFRQGKVPIEMIKKIYGKEIETRVAEEKIPTILDDIREENDLKLIGPVKLEDFSYDNDHGLNFKVTLEVVPQIELEKYKDLAFEKKVYEITDDDLNDALENLREQHATMNTIDSEAQQDHFVVADFQKIDASGIPLVGEKYENRYFQLSTGENPADNQLMDQLLGVKIGDKRKVQLTFQAPENQDQIDYYEVTIKEIKEKVLPELDDEFAKDAGEYESLADLKDKMTEDLKRRVEEEYDFMFTQHVINEIVKANSFELPEPMIKNFLDMMVERQKRSSQGRPFDEEEFRNKYRPDAIRQIKWSLIKDKLAELEGITIDDAEVDEHVESIAQKNKDSRSQITTFYRTKENRENLKEDLLEKKVAKWVAEQGKVSETRITRNEMNKESNIIT